MTRKTRPRQLRIHTAFQSGFCAVCHLPYNSLDDHIQSKKHQKLIGDDVGFISLKAFDDDTSLTSFLALDDIDAIAINTRPYDCSPPHPQPKRRRMPRTARTAPPSVTTTCDRPARAKESSPLSPVDSDSGGGHHRLRSRKNINYMTPPLEEDSLTEKPDDDDEEGEEEVKEFRELRSSTRLMAKLTTQIPENDEVWNSGRPKRRCNRQRISADERLVVDNKSYYKVEVLPTKLRSGVAPFNMDFVGRHRSPESNNHPLSSDQRKNDQGLIVKFKKMRNSELVQLNNEAENFLFPKKDDSSDDEDSDGDEEENGGEGTTTEDDAPSADSNYVMKTDTSSISLDPTVTMTTTTDENTCSSHQTTSRKSLKSAEDDESQHSTCSESKSGGAGGGGGGFGGRKRKRRTHAEAFIMDNQKYYKFETPGSRLRYHGSYLSPLNWKTKNNGDCCGGRTPKEDPHDPDTEIDPNFKLNLNDYNFSFEKVPKEEGWFQTFQRRDRGEEKYAFLGDDNYWDPLILPYQLKSVPPLDPKSCISQYTHIKKCLDTAATSETNMEPTASASTSISCNTSDLNPSNNSSQPGNNENTQHQSQPEDEDSKISAATSTVSDEDSCCSSSQTQVPQGPANGGDDVVKSPPPAAVSPTRRKAGRPPKLKKRTDIVQQTVANVSPTGGGADNKGRNPRKSPRQHASTLAILSSLIHQRKRKARRAEMNNRSHLPTIMEEPRSRTSPIKVNNRSRHLNQNQQRRENILKTQEYLSIAKKFEEELTQMGCGDVANLLSNDEVEDTRGEQLELLATTSAGTTTATTAVETPGGSAFNDSSPIDFRTSINIIDVLHSYDSTREKDTKASQKRFLQGNKHEARKPGRKKKKNMTGWPNRCRRVRRDRGDNVKEEDDNSTVDSGSINADSADENDDILGDHVTDSIIKGNSRKKDASKLLNGESNNKKTENSSSVANLNTSTISSSSSKVTENNSSIIDSIKCDSKVNSESVKNNSSNSAKVNLNLQPYVRVQKLDKSRLGGRGGGLVGGLEQHPTTSGAQHQQSRRGGGSGNGNSNDTSPRRAIRGQRRRRMPASPKSPRMLRRPRGRWYRER